MVKEEEGTRKGASFDLVVLARTDLVVYNAFKPFCMYNLKLPRKQGDWLFLTPRRLAEESFVKPFVAMRSCNWPVPDFAGNLSSLLAAFTATYAEDPALPVLPIDSSP